jgi:hypothetical protein
MEEKEFFELQLEMDKINTEKSYLMLKLKDEYNCDSVEEAKKELRRLKNKINNLKSQLL